jgi:hypothetical protein
MRHYFGHQVKEYINLARRPKYKVITSKENGEKRTDYFFSRAEAVRFANHTEAADGAAKVFEILE